ncbi:MAG: RIO1 family regulatory kinase/ATPase [Candidatus Pacearchaeota archaeon]|jgi:tRNA A-37 threonylcarbamoyl transferase component Bud32
MVKNKILAQGAEAIISLDSNKIIKNRLKKSYRISIIDERLRKSRTKSEAKIITKLFSVIPVPKILKTDEKQIIEMEFISGKKLSSSLEGLDYKKICKLIGENITKMHNQGIIHGDLTTSNMIYVEGSKDRKKSSSKKSEQSEDFIDFNKVYFIDFGLAFHSQKIEDKAVDLHLLEQALEAKHFTIWQECVKTILDNYKPEKYKEIIQRIKVIESRGRYKDKY